MKRLLIYSQDGMGLGHLRRTRNIAREVLAMQPECQVLAVADAPDAPFFARLPGMEFLKLPTIVKAGRAGWRTHASSMEVKDVVSRRSAMILEAFEEFQPDAVLVDHMPVGVEGELKPTLESATRKRPRPSLYLGLRDILDTPETIHEAWTELSAYDYLPEYDTVLIHGCREIYDAEAVYGLGAHVRTLRYNNYVAPAQRTTAHAQTTSEPFVLAMGGGGADAFPLAKTFLEAMPAILRETPLHAVLLTGPNMPPAERDVLVAEARKYPVDVRTSSQDATTLLQKASAVVTMGGYNTLCEVLTWQAKAVVVPRSGPSAEQRIRSRLFAERGLIRTLEPESLTPARLAEELLELLANGHELPKTANIPPLDGARRAAELLVGAAVAEGAAVATDAVSS